MKTCIILCFSLFFTIVQCYYTINSTIALENLYYSTNGDNWDDNDGWLTNTNPCTWYGIDCDDYSNITSIRLNYNNLVGSLPESFNIPTLEILDLSSNSDLVGSIPEYDLPSLLTFSMSQCDLTGSVPELESSTYLQSISLHSNQLSGTLPQWRTKSDLEFIYLDNNQITGMLPQWNSLHRIKAIYIRNNLIEGQLPEWRIMKELETLYLDGNKLTGTLPNWNELQNLQYLNLHENDITGTIPNDWKFNSLEYMSISGNKLTGTLPNWIEENFPKLRTIDLGYNQLTGNLPSFENLPTMGAILIADNNFEGRIPLNWPNLPNLYLLYLQNNNLCGYFPPFSNDFYIYAGGNSFICPIPSACSDCNPCSYEGLCFLNN